MALRTSWKFQYRGSVLYKYAQELATHHQERRYFWENELTIAEDTLRATGVDFRESQITGGQRIDLVLDPQKQARVQECRNKVDEHKKLEEEYETYARAFQLNPDVNLELDVSDMRFFEL